MVKQVDTRDLKSLGKKKARAGSIPAARTNQCRICGRQLIDVENKGKYCTWDGLYFYTVGSKRKDK